MKKHTKIILSSILPITLVGGVGLTLLQVSCGGTKDDIKFDKDIFIKNNNAKYIDLTTTPLASSDKLNTPEVAKSVLATSDGINNMINYYADAFIADWFSKVNDPILKSFYNDELEAIKEELQSKKDGYKNNELFQREVLDPTGGTETTYVFQNLIPKLRTKLSETIFGKNYLAIKDKNGEIIKLENSQTNNAVNDVANINGVGGKGNPNRFVFDKGAVNSPTKFDQFYADFTSFIFKQWIADTMPILSPSVLFKNPTEAPSTDLFNKGFFGTALDAESSSYKFQWFPKANGDFNTPNSEMKYQEFIKQKDSFINATTGAIDIPKKFTDDSSTTLITNISNGFDTLVAPYASAVVYKFSQSINDFSSNDVSKASSFEASGIMKNFITTSPNSDYFTLPYIASGDNPFLGDYAGVKGIRETVDIQTSPWIITRNEFGVHIIGIDRFDQMKGLAFDGVLTELGNTILWRSAQKLVGMNPDFSLDLKNELSTYFQANFSKLIFEYVKSNSSSNDYLFGKASITDGQSLNYDLIKNNKMTPVFEAALEFKKIEQLIKIADVINEKIFALQSGYNNNSKPSEWKTYGLAGVLPYNLDAISGYFNALTYPLSQSCGATSISDVQTKLNSAKTKLSSAISLLTIQPANSNNYFNDNTKIGKQVGVSQYTFTDNFLINRLLVTDASATSVASIYNSLWDEHFVKTLATGLSSPGSGSDINSWTNKNLKTAIEQNYYISNIVGSAENKATLNLDWSNLETLQTKTKEKFEKDLANLKLGNYLLSIDYDSNWRTFLKSLTWLLTPDQNNKYTYANLISVLKEMIKNETLGVGYVGWMSTSNVFIPSNQFGTNAETDFTYKNPIYYTNINQYSYKGAKPYDWTAPSLATNYYFGTETSWFNSAKSKKSGASTFSGFLGFQSSSSTLTSSTLPSELFSGTQLTQNTKNEGYQNYKGIFYQYTKANNDGKANMKQICETAQSQYDLKIIAEQILNFEFGFLLNNIIVNGNSMTIKQALESVINQTSPTGVSLTLEQIKAYLSAVIDRLPDVAFSKLDGDSLYSKGKKLFEATDSTGQVTQYVVSQFNLHDIETFEAAVKSSSTSLSFAGLDDSAFFSAIVLLAQNSEIQSRSNLHWTDLRTKEKVVVYNYLLAQKLGQNVVKNWDDFK